MVCPNVAIEVLVDSARHGRGSNVSLVPGLRLSHG